MARKHNILVLALVLVGSCKLMMAFAFSPGTAKNRRPTGSSQDVCHPFCLSMSPPPAQENENDVNLPLVLDRRGFVLSTAGRAMAVTAAVASASPPSVALAAAASYLGDSPDRPVAVIGAGGKTGMEVTQALAKQGIYTVTLTRTGLNPFRMVKLPETLKPYVQHYEAPVALPSKDAFQEAMTSTHASALIYCASASRQGGSSSQVDDLGVGTAAEVAQALKARLVVISALAVDRPDSKTFQMTNTIGGNFNGIMDAKRLGEDKVRQVMKNKNYVIIRPGFLMSGKGSGSAADLELNQGDTVGGGISRDELAQLAVAALQIPSKDGITVEAYRKKTATKLQPEFKVPSGKELSADTYVGMFQKALVDEAGMPYLPK
jgi:dTDP-4-dehydrorhamnose reductase